MLGVLAATYKNGKQKPLLFISCQILTSLVPYINIFILNKFWATKSQLPDFRQPPDSSNKEFKTLSFCFYVYKYYINKTLH